MLTKHLISKLSAGLGTGNRVASATIKTSAKHYAERRDGHKSPRIALLAAMMIAIMMTFAMTNEAKAQCPEGFVSGGGLSGYPPLPVITLPEGCKLTVAYCIKPNSNPLQIVINELQIEGDCGLNNADLLANYKKYVDTAMFELVKRLSNIGFIILPNCPGGNIVIRYGHPSCVTDPYTVTIHIANGPPTVFKAIASCSVTYTTDEYCWNTATYCWRELEGKRTLVQNVVYDGTDTFTCPATIQVHSIDGIKTLKCNPICKW